MAFYVDLTNTNPNNYRRVKPNGVTLVDYSGSFTDIDDDIPAYTQSATPATTTPSTTLGTFSNDGQRLIYIGNGNTHPEVTVDFQSLNEVATADGGPGFLDFTTSPIANESYFRTIVTTTNSSTQTANNITFDITLIGANGVVGSASQNLPASTFGTNSYFFVRFTLTPAIAGNDIYGGPIQCRITQTSGGTGGQATRRNRVEVLAVDWFANTLDLEVYTPRSYTYLT